MKFAVFRAAFDEIYRNSMKIRQICMNLYSFLKSFFDISSRFVTSEARCTWKNYFGITSSFHIARMPHSSSASGPRNLLHWAARLSGLVVPRRKTAVVFQSEDTTPATDWVPWVSCYVFSNSRLDRILF